MTYTTAKAAEKIGISAHTLRFYDKEGLLPNVGRDEHGNRRFTDNDLQWLSLLQCLKNTGMSLKDIKRFAECTSIGDDTIDERLETEDLVGGQLVLAEGEEKEGVI